MSSLARLSLAFMLCAGMGYAQTATTAPEPTDTTKKDPIPVENVPATSEVDDELIVLTPFEVTSKTDKGYQATQTLAGTRIRTNLKDVGAAISVVTPEFLRDTGATDSASLLQYTTSSEVAGTKGTYTGLGNGSSVNESTTLIDPTGAQRVRGLDAADNTRDFFVTDIPWDSFNTERIDIQRGPNSIMFGLGSPAGIINASTRNAELTKSKYVAQIRTGSYGSLRKNFDINQVLIPGVLAVRLDGLWNNDKYRQSQAFQDDNRLYTAVRFDPELFKDRGFHTTIKFKHETGDITANRPRIVPPVDSITPWFRELDSNPSARTLEGGMGKTSINNAYEVGAASQSVNPWVSGVADQQQPIWFVDGTSNQLYRIYGGFVNLGARSSTGAILPTSSNLVGQRYATTFYRLSDLAAYAKAASLPGSQYGQYRAASLTDASVFDFYNNLIDGPTKSEWSKWKASNFELSETAFEERLGVQLYYDIQSFERGGQQLLGGSPAISIDFLRNFQDRPDVASTAAASNLNYGRAFVTAGPGYGSSYKSDRNYTRGSIFGELRSSDFFEKKSFLTKLLGKHRFNGVYSNEDYEVETRSWNMYGHTQAWDSYWNKNDGTTNAGRPPAAVIYLGPSLANNGSAAGAYIPAISKPVTYQDGNMYFFNSTWTNPVDSAGQPIGFSAPWAALGAVPANVAAMFTTTTTGLPQGQTALYQNSNPANYVGWNSNYAMTVKRYNNGEDLSLLTNAQKTFRNTKSYALSYQGFLWNEAIIPTLGWRYDVVKTKAVTALPVSSARNALNLNSDNSTSWGYNYWNDYLPPVDPVTGRNNSNKSGSIFKEHSTAGGLVVHLNKILEKDYLPIDIRLSYNKSNNFQVTNTRRDIWGTVISNPSGKTKDYGITLSTKDNKYALRALKYETTISNATTQLDVSRLTSTIKNGLNWRNVILYQLTNYYWGAPSGPNILHNRNDWKPVYVDATGRGVRPSTWANPDPSWRLQTEAEAIAMRDATLRSWNEIQVWLEDRGYFNAWNYTPTTSSVLTDRATFEANPAAYTPDPNTVKDYRPAPALQGFAVTADTESKGYEFELIANPTENIRIMFNASQTEAIRNNIGGKNLTELVNFLTERMSGAAGDLRMFNAAFDDPNNVLWKSTDWTTFRGDYLLMKLQEGAATSELRKWRYNIVGNYTFTKGMLKGLEVGASYRWQDKVILGYPVIAVDERNFTYDLANPYYGRAEDALDFKISYERKITDKIGWLIQLNVRNALIKNGKIPVSVQPDGQTWATVRTKPVQEWYLTNTFTY